MTTKASDVRAAAGRFSGVAPALERVEQIDARLAAIAQEEKSARRPLLPKVEVADRLVEWIRSRQENYARPRSYSGDRLPVPAVISRLCADRAAPLHFEGVEALDLLLWLLGPAADKMARAAVDGTEYAEGLPSAERARIVAALAAERESLVAEREGRVETCREAGVEVAHLPETQQRIDAERRAAELRAAERAQQEEVKRGIEARERAASGSAEIGRMKLESCSTYD